MKFQVVYVRVWKCCCCGQDVIYNPERLTQTCGCHVDEDFIVAPELLLQNYRRMEIPLEVKT